MTRDEVVTLLENREKASTLKDAALAASYHSEDCVVESPVAGGVVTGRAAIERTYRAFFSAFPDLTIEGSDLVIDGNRAVWFFTFSGTDQGGFMGLPPTRKAFRSQMVVFSELRDGLIVRERRIYDFTGMLVQVGLLKTKPA